MTEKEEQLLRKDLCARLPYDVKVDNFGKTEELVGILHNLASVGYDINDFDDVAIEDIKPYLRPISSMTEKETVEWHEITLGQRWITFDNIERCVEWLLSHYFDYRGLIEKGLALEAPEGMYEIK